MKVVLKVMENSKIINKIEENRNGIENILDKSSLDLEQKNVLKKVFKKLSKYSLDQLNGIENTVFENYKNTQIFTENLNKDCHFDIYTALVNKKQKKEFLSFNPIVDENLFGIFIDISYRDFVDICNGNKCSANITLTNGSSLSIQFNLNASNPFKSSEELLVKLIKQYGIRKSVIFSPYARRFVEIPLPENIKVEDIAFISVDIPNVSTEQIKSTLEYTLMWNVTIITDMQRIPCTKRIKPYFNETINEYAFENFGLNEYIVCSSKDIIPKFEIIRQDKETIKVTSHDEVYYQHVKINPVQSDSFKHIMLFENYFKYSLMFKERICSYADICYVLNYFNDNPYDIEILYLQKSAQVYNSSNNKVCMYKFPYYNRNLSLRNAINYENHYKTIPICKNICVLSFKSNNKKYSNYVDDFANYVLDFLTEMYPEYNWVGEL